MKVLIVYDSYFNNTKLIAEKIAETLAKSGDVSIHRSRDMKPEQLTGLDILVAGSPTQKARPTADIKSLLNSIRRGALKGLKAAAFDTRISIDDAHSTALRWFVKIFGYAAEPLAGKLKRKGCEMLLPPEGFIVQGTKGPLKEGELERAAEWAKKIASAAS